MRAGASATAPGRHARPVRRLAALVALVAVAVALAAPRAGAVERVARAGPVVVREGPAAAAPAIAVLPQRERARFLGERDGWSEVELGDGRRGWVLSVEIAAVSEAVLPPAAGTAGAAPPAAGEKVDLDTGGEVAALRADIESLKSQESAALGHVREEIAALRAAIERSMPETRPDGAAAVGSAWPGGERLLVAGGCFVAGLLLGIVVQRRRARRERSLRF